jgi:hypothetical protein
MTDDRKSGIALIAGSLGGIVTMAIHPRGSGAGPLTADQVAHLAFASATAHTLAMFSFLVLFLGACGLVRRIAAADRIAFAAIVTYGFACVAVLIAAAVSGFIVPSIMRHMVRDVPAAVQQWKIVIDGIFQINQAFARIYAVAASIAIILWSVSVLRNGGLGRAGAIYGCVVAPVIILGIGIGHLRLDVHGMIVIALGQAIWFIIIGAQLCSRYLRGDDTVTPPVSTPV